MANKKNYFAPVQVRVQQNLFSIHFRFQVLQKLRFTFSSDSPVLNLKNFDIVSLKVRV